MKNLQNKRENIKRYEKLISMTSCFCFCVVGCSQYFDNYRNKIIDIVLHFVNNILSKISNNTLQQIISAAVRSPPLFISFMRLRLLRCHALVVIN